MVNDFISVNGLTTSTAVSTANNYIIPNGMYQVTAVTSTTVQYQITTPSALTLTPTVSSATVIGQTAVNGVVGGLGVGQTPVDLTTQRAIGTTYYNTSGKPISVTVWVVSTSSSTNVSLLINCVTSILVGGSTSGLNMTISSQIIPNGSNYQISVINATLVGWKELR